VNSVGGSILAIVVAAALGYPLAHFWQEFMKRREIALTLEAQFYRLYGTFFQTWKLWNYAFIPPPGSERPDPSAIEAAREPLLKAISAAEADLEATLLKVVCGRRLAAVDVQALGTFRQAYQQLRSCMRDRKKLEWKDPEDPEYVAFKRSSAAVAYIVSTIEIAPLPEPREMQDKFTDVTAARWERDWRTLPVPAPAEVRTFLARLGLRRRLRRGA
jgi:hypothetical protein